MKLKKGILITIIVIFLIIIFISSFYIKNALHNNEDSKELWDSRIENVKTDTSSTNNNLN
ncbi:hypothetical protein [Flavobacterium amniphilum]|uniref:hypothetical protein n=1 Tax=Flavobacterium amniphilum TaxID=1834035 RepID=UPI00202A128B|nr:hypothetical protein [Flavobacterium amniphilum]